MLARLRTAACAGGSSRRIAAQAPLRPRPRRQRLCVAASAAEYEALVGHIKAAGGWVHPELQLAPGGNGIVAAADVPAGADSLVQLPLSLRLTPAAAQEMLLPAVNAAGLPTMALLEPEEQLALALAWLRKQAQQQQQQPQPASAGAAAGQDADAGAEALAVAKWAPYVAALPAESPAGWAKSPQQLAADWAACLHVHGLDAAWWLYFAAQVQAQLAEQAQQLAVRFGRALQLSAADVAWGLGQVQARKVVVDGEVLLEPWSDLLRHPPGCSSASSSGSCNGSSASSDGSRGRCEVDWTYSLDSAATSVVSKGAGRRVGSGPPQPAGSSEPRQPLLLAAGEELWASSAAGAGAQPGVGDVFSQLVAEQGHLAPLAWWLQHGSVPAGLRGVDMRTSGILDSWRAMVDSEAGASSSSTSSGSSSGGGGGGSGPATVLWDYLTAQYQQDALTVLAAVPVQQQQRLLAWLLSPVGAAEAASASAASAAAVRACGLEPLVCSVDPLPMIQQLDALMLAAIDAAEEAEASQQQAAQPPPQQAAEA